MANDIGYEQLVDYVEGRLDPQTTAAVEAYLQHDASAALEVSRLRHTVTLMRADMSTDAPAAAIQRATRLLRQRRQSAPSQPSLLQRILAVLTHDSAVSPVVGLRDGQSATRHILFSAANRDLDIRINASDAGFMLSGQVLGPESPGSITLSSEDISVSTQLNAMGEYTLPSVPAGRYELILMHGELEIVVPELELGASQRRS